MDLSVPLQSCTGIDIMKYMKTGRNQKNI